MGNAAQVASEMQAWALAKWAQTEGMVREFATDAEMNMRAGAPGPDTGTLDSSIKAEENSLGVFSLEVKTFVEPNANPITGWTADVYNYYWNYGHFNIYRKTSIPPTHHMETGAEEAYAELQGKLSGIWSGI